MYQERFSFSTRLLGCFPAIDQVLFGIALEMEGVLRQHFFLIARASPQPESVAPEREKTRGKQHLKIITGMEFQAATLP